MNLPFPIILTSSIYKIKKIIKILLYFTKIKLNIIKVSIY